MTKTELYDKTVNPHGRWEEPIYDNDNLKVTISHGNSKMGAIPSVSLPPILTCPDNCPCAKKCYAAKMCRIYPSVKRSYENNLHVLNTDRRKYFEQVENAVKMSRYFRFHVSGDIPDLSYFVDMVLIAARNPGTHLLAFTKRYDIVNAYLDYGGKIPENLKIIFSEWGSKTIPNPHNLPTAAVIFKGCEPAENWKICGGNCAECACQGVGCWELKNGETIAFYEH